MSDSFSFMVLKNYVNLSFFGPVTKLTQDQELGKSINAWLPEIWLWIELTSNLIYILHCLQSNLYYLFSSGLQIKYTKKVTFEAQLK